MNTYDTIIIGAGPAGTSAGTYLAQKGWRVLIVDRETFPRYVIGESMLPYCYFPLEKIGMIGKMKASDFTKKYSVQFVRKDGASSLPFYFEEHLGHEAAMTWQVERRDFDQMMVDHAKENGVEFHKSVTVTDLNKDRDGRYKGIQVRNRRGKISEFSSDMIVDASGQAALTATRNGWRIKDPCLKKIAIWTYFRGATRGSGIDEGATTIAYLDNKNWIWFIPLRDDIVSVGVVGDKDYLYKDVRDPESILNRESNNNQWIKSHLQGGKRNSDYFVTGDISYRSKYSAANGLVLVGDAFAFLDPVFSSGLYLALQSGVLAAEAIDNALKIRDLSASQFVDYSKRMCLEIENMRQLVYAFYNPDFSFGSVIKKHPHLKADLTDCLIGNLNRDFSEMFDAISEYTSLPEPLSHGLARINSV